MAKKVTKKAAATKKPAKKKKTSTRAPGAKASREKATEIVFSYGEIDFLRKITKRDVEETSPRERKARLSLRDKLLDINFSVPAVGAGGLIVVELGRGEVDFLQRITKEVYSFITAEERRARLILREKILIAVEKVTGKKILPEEPL
ncbi:MAG TPA: hypothetical protein VLK65_01485 [Vicinamibacteria bacterium]|nr:hypothetical protein [Vicinamibacteria bacterium]